MVRLQAPLAVLLGGGGSGATHGGQVDSIGIWNYKNYRLLIVMCDDGPYETQYKEIYIKGKSTTSTRVTLQTSSGIFRT